MLPSVEDVLLSLSYSLFTALKINEKKGGKWKDEEEGEMEGFRQKVWIE